jgi:hypothetical protein
VNKIAPGTAQTMMKSCLQTSRDKGVISKYLKNAYFRVTRKVHARRADGHCLVSLPCMPRAARILAGHHKNPVLGRMSGAASSGRTDSRGRLAKNNGHSNTLTKAPLVQARQANWGYPSGDFGPITTRADISPFGRLDKYASSKLT